MPSFPPPSKRSSFSIPDTLPPPYNTPPPSFRSSPPASQAGEDYGIIEEPQHVYTTPRKYSDKAKPKPNTLSKSKPKPLFPIIEKIEPTRPIVADPEAARDPPPVPRSVFVNICSNNVFNCCISNRTPWCWIAILLLVFLIIAAIVLGVVLPRELKPHHDAFPANATVVSTVTSVIYSTATQVVTTTTPSATTTTTPSATPSDTPDIYLGGFDAVAKGSYTYIFYTDQDDGLQGVYISSSWQRTTPSTLASNVRPGSPVSASIAAGYIHIFYVDNNNMLRGIHGDPVNPSAAIFQEHPVSSLNLSVSDNMFLRSCVVVDYTTYSYTNTSSDNVWLYFQDEKGVMRRFVFTGLSSPRGEEMADLPELGSARELECQFAGGVETLWLADEASHLTSFYRSENTTWDWVKGYTGTDKTFWASSILALSDSSTGRTHVLFQDEDLSLRQYDFDGFGENLIRSSNFVVNSSITPGTRLSTWANDAYCGTYVSVYYQQDNTSDVSYSMFKDNSVYSYGYASRYSSTYTAQGLVPLLRTYGRNVDRPEPSSHSHTKTKSIVSGVFGVIVFLLVLCCCCGLCS